jgi:TPR repeat protein
MTRLTLLFCSLILVSTTTLATPNKPECADEECSLAKLNTLRSLATRGNEEVSFTLGHIFMNPESGVKTDIENSFYYFNKAANQGFLPAYRQTAGMLAQGLGTEKNLSEAKRWMKRAAKRGVNRTAEEYAVLVFSDPNSSDEEHQEALAMLKEQVEEGMSYLANYMLAVLHVDGQFINQDYELAAELLAFPASGNYANSVQLLSQISELTGKQTEVIASNADAGLDPNIETITVSGISESLEDLSKLMLTQLQSSRSGTGSHIPGNGCKRKRSYCNIIENGWLRNETYLTFR